MPLVTDAKSKIPPRRASPLRGEARSTTAGGENQKSKPQIKARKILTILPVIFLLLAFLFLIYEIYLPHSSAAGAQEVVILPGMGSRSIAQNLKHAGAIRSKWAFIIYVSLTGQAHLLKPGTYNFVSPSIAEIAEALAASEPSDLVITIPEGWSAGEIGAYLQRRGVAGAAAFEELVSPAGSRAFADRFPFLRGRPASVGLEGYLFPDTYAIYPDAKPEDVIVRMLENFDRRLDPLLRSLITRQGKTIFQIITMASLIEKEVRSDEDRAVVSGILWKRLGAGIPLQVDASITYIKKYNAKRITNNGRISIKDTQIDSPYNTYRSLGLPLGPIANPGLSAIRAALYPKSSPYLYYLSAPDGRTIFSRILEEHIAAKAKYLTAE